MAKLFGRRDVGAAAFLTALTVLFSWPLTLQGRVLVSFDTLVYFYPQEVYLAERLREGQLPLWDPYLFAGVPFLANSQAGVLYPPNWLFLVGPISVVAAWLIVGHIWWLALGSYALARISLRLTRLGAMFAATAIAFGGFVGGMSGHFNQVEAFAWTPLAVLLIERAAATASKRLMFLAAIPFACCALAGHSQVLYIAGCLAELAGGSRLIERWVAKPPWRYAPGLRELSGLIGADLATILVGPAVAALIAAAQLVPTLELTRLGIRSTGLSFGDAAAFSLPPPRVLIALLPSIHQGLPTTEWVGYLGVTTLVLAIVGVWRRPERPALWLLAVALLGLLLAFGEFTPLFPVAFTLLPGFRLFRVPARWLTIWTFAVALLAGWGLDTLVTFPISPNPWRARLRSVAHWWPAPVIVGVAVAGLAYHFRQLIMWPTSSTLALWGVILVGCGILLGPLRRLERVVAVGFVVLLLGELGVASLDLPIQQAVWPDAVETSRLTVDHLVATGTNDRVLALGDNSYDPGDLTSIRTMLAGTISSDASDQYVTAIKHVEGLTPDIPLRFNLRTLDGYDGGVLPLARYDALKQLFPSQGPDVEDGRLRIRLKSAPPPALLSWLNVRYLLMDRLRDQWIDGHYYDLGVSQPLDPGSSTQLTVQPAFATTAVGVILTGSTKSPPAGTLQLAVAGQTVSIATGQIAGKALTSDVDPNGLWYWKVALPRVAVASAVAVTWRGDDATTLRALTLIDDRIPADQTVTVSPALNLDLLGDMKIYENKDVLPRAFLTNGLTTEPSLTSVVASLKQASWNPRAAAVAVATDVPAGAAFTSSGTPGDARIVQDQPESVTVETAASSRRVLVLTDSAYPGWRATVDGAPVPIYTVNVLFRGVVVPAGNHQVTFVYQPTSWRVGLALSAIGILVLLWGLIATGRAPNRIDAT